MGMSLWQSAGERMCEWLLLPSPESAVGKLIVAGLKI